MKCLTLELDGETMEVHMLNPREHFPLFGGSRHGLTVGKTASLVLRRESGMGTVDTELDIHAASFWRLIAACINGEHPGAKARGEDRDTPGKGAASGTAG